MNLFIILMYFFYFIAFLLWTVIISLLIHHTSHFKLATNLMSSIHAISVILSYLLDISGQYLFYWSSTYYFIDTIIVFLRFRGLYDFGLVIHHIIVILILKSLYDPLISLYIYYIFFVAEFSNLPMYVVHHMKLINFSNKIIMKFLIFIEAASFFIFRIIMGAPILYDFAIVQESSILIFFAGCIIYIISLMWLKTLVLQLIR